MQKLHHEDLFANDNKKMKPVDQLVLLKYMPNQVDLPTGPDMILKKI